MNRYFNPSDIAPPAGRYSQGVEITNPGQTLYIAGQVGIRPDGSLPEDMEEQAEQAFLNIQGVLRGANMDVENLVSIRTYLLSRDDLPKFRAARDRVFGDVAPASTLLIISGLAQPEWLIEVDARAYK
jgi:2-iminobutanoate/2-iminopropanoate deaminase